LQGLWLWDPEYRPIELESKNPPDFFKLQKGRELTRQAARISSLTTALRGFLWCCNPMLHIPRWRETRNWKHRGDGGEGTITFEGCSVFRSTVEIFCSDINKGFPVRGPIDPATVAEALPLFVSTPRKMACCCLKWHLPSLLLSFS